MDIPRWTNRRVIAHVYISGKLQDLIKALQLSIEDPLHKEILVDYEGDNEITLYYNEPESDESYNSRLRRHEFAVKEKIASLKRQLKELEE